MIAVAGVLGWRAVAALALAAAMAAGYGWIRHAHMEQGRAEVRAEWAEERRQGELQAEIRREANRANARAAELQQVAQTVYRDRFITQTITEIRHVTDPLAACPVPPDAVRMLNDAAACARSDRPASCGSGQPVPSS